MLVDDLKVFGILLHLDQMQNESPDRIFDEFGTGFVFSRMFIDRFD